MAGRLEAECKSLHGQCVGLRAAADEHVRKASEEFSVPRPYLDTIWRSTLRKDHEIFGTVLELGSTPGNRGHAMAAWDRLGGRPRRFGGNPGGSGIG